MLLGNTVKLPHMTLRLVPKILDTVDMILFVCKKFGMVDAKMLKVRDVQDVVTAPTVRIDDTIRHHLAFNDRL